MRHPVYLCFLGLIWFTPKMTLDHAVLTGIWTIYIGLGSILKDQRLLFYLGDSYRIYMEKVAGYPIVTLGPLARRTPRAADKRQDNHVMALQTATDRDFYAVDEVTQHRAA